MDYQVKPDNDTFGKMSSPPPSGDPKNYFYPGFPAGVYPVLRYGAENDNKPERKRASALLRNNPSPYAKGEGMGACP